MIETHSTFWSIVKNGSYIPAFIIGAGISPEVFNALAILILIDTFTGIIKAGVTHGWRTIRSKTMANGIIAKLVLILIPVTLAALAQGVDIDITPLVKSSLTVLLLSESYSILGNIYSIKTKEDAPEFDAVNIILKKINRLLEALSGR